MTVSREPRIERYPDKANVFVYTFPANVIDRQLSFRSIFKYACAVVQSDERAVLITDWSMWP